MNTPQAIAGAPAAAQDELKEGIAGYEPPAIRRLGSLAEMTQGGTTGPNDGFGGAGANGSI